VSGGSSSSGASSSDHRTPRRRVFLADGRTKIASLFIEIEKKAVWFNRAAFFVAQHAPSQISFRHNHHAVMVSETAAEFGVHAFRARRLHFLERYKQSYCGPPTHRDGFASANFDSFAAFIASAARWPCIFSFACRLIFVVIQVVVATIGFLRRPPLRHDDPGAEGFQSSIDACPARLHDLNRLAAALAGKATALRANVPVR